MARGISVNPMADLVPATPLEAIVGGAVLLPGLLLTLLFDFANIHAVVLLNSVIWGAATYFMLGVLRRVP